MLVSGDAGAADWSWLVVFSAGDSSNQASGLGVVDLQWYTDRRSLVLPVKPWLVSYLQQCVLRNAEPQFNAPGLHKPLKRTVKASLSWHASQTTMRAACASASRCVKLVPSWKTCLACHQTRRPNPLWSPTTTTALLASLTLACRPSMSLGCWPQEAST